MPSEVSSFRRQSFFTVTASATFKYKPLRNALTLARPEGGPPPPLSPGCLGKHGFHRGAHCVKVDFLLCVFYLLDGIRPEKSIQYGAVDKVSQQPRFTAKKYGCPAIDPVVIVKYLQVGFLYGIPSERQIERRIQADIALRWYLGFDRVPDHSTVSQLRRRQPPGLLFAQMQPLRPHPPSGLLPSKGTV